MNSTSEVTIIGGGLIGLGVASALLREGLGVTVVGERRDGHASGAAAGMLAWRSEKGSVDHLALARRSAELWVEWIDALGGADALDAWSSGTLLVLPDAESQGRVERSQRELGLPVETLDERALGALGLRGEWGLRYPDEGCVDPRKVLDALEDDCRARGMTLLAERAERIVVEGGRVVAVETPTERIDCGTVVNCTGAWSAQLGPAPAPVRPVRGQVLVLRGEVPGIVRGSGVYLVPRRGGRVVVGSTMEDAGFDATTTKEALDGLARAAGEVAAPLDGAERLDCWAGLRPVTTDGAPLVGPSQTEGLWYATGHGRNGVLFAPVTAELVAAWVVDGAPAQPAPHWHPERYGL